MFELSLSSQQKQNLWLVYPIVEPLLSFLSLIILPRRLLSSAFFANFWAIALVKIKQLLLVARLVIA